MKHTVSVSLLVILISLFCVVEAVAAPRAVQVRIEGKTTTLFDATVLTDAGQFQAASDQHPRTCDTTNLGHTDTPQAALTGAAVDAMSTIGEAFDGDWNAGFEDYFVTQFAGDRESNGDGQWWGALLNWNFTTIGGCQQPVLAGDEVLFVYDAFNGKDILQLRHVGATKVVLGEPVTVQVNSVETGSVDSPGSNDETPYPGATVAAVNATGQDVDGVATNAVSDGDGLAVVSFQQSGWQRLKARHLNDDPGDPLFGQNRAIASDSVDICVVEDVADDCAGEPPSRIPRVPSRLQEPVTPGVPTDGSTGIPPAPPVLPPAAALTPPAAAPRPSWLALARQARCLKRCAKVRNRRATGGRYLRLRRGGRATLVVSSGQPTLRIGPRAKSALLAVKVGRRTKLVRLRKGRGLTSLRLNKQKKRTRITLTARRGTILLDAVRVVR